MDRTSICCPSCNIHISIALRPPLISCCLPMDLDYSHIPSNKDYNLTDILYVNEELIRENKYLRERIEKLNNSLTEYRGF